MNIRTIGALLALTATLAACGSAGIPAPDEVQRHIDPEIQGEERRLISEHMRTLPPSDWENVTYVKDGRVYVNRARLKGVLEVAQPLGDNLYQNSRGQTFTIPASPPEGGGVGALTTTCGGSSGPFRRLATKPGVQSLLPGTNTARFGYSYATVSPPIFALDTSVSVNNTSGVSETPYAYLGGHGSSGPEVDAGLQYNTGAGEWGAFLNVGGTVFSTMRARYAYDSQVGVEFKVISDGNVRLSIHAPSTTSGIPNPYTLDVAAAGFKLDGRGNVMKRVTSIAQATSSGDVTNANTGAYYGAAWLEYKLGASATSGLHDWGQYSNDVDPANDCVNPNATEVQITALGQFSEEIVIDL